MIMMIMIYDGGGGGGGDDEETDDFKNELNDDGDNSSGGGVMIMLKIMGITSRGTTIAEYEINAKINTNVKTIIQLSSSCVSS